jgi:large subunit ribosomal protein L23
MQKTAHEIIRRPLLTEKSNWKKELDNQIVFEVRLDANKLEIKAAVQELFDVRVTSVRTQVVRGKQKRLGRFTGKKPNWKKAIVTLHEGDNIDFFEGVAA